MTRTLFIAPQIPWPLDVGSKIRVHNLLRCYAEMGDVTLVCFAETESDAQSVRHLEQYCRQAHCLAVDAASSARKARSGKLRALVEAVQIEPRAVRYFSSRKLAVLVQSQVATGDFDIIHVERLFMAQNVQVLPQSRDGGRRPLLVLDVDDLESDKVGRLAALHSWRSPKKYLELLELLKLKVFERRVLPRFDCVLVCSEKDRLQLARSRRSPSVEVFSNGAELGDSTLPSGLVDDGLTLVFLGAMNYQPNDDAALYLANSIFPLIREQRPGVRVLIAGKSPSAALKALHNGTDVIVTGYVDDKDRLFASCTVFVVPLRVGGGTRLKILEAMAFGKPVVSTAIGCEGLDVTPGANILVADSPRDFANACVGLLADEQARQVLGGAGRELVQRSYRWEAIRTCYIRLLEKGPLGLRRARMPAMSVAADEDHRS